MDNPIRLRLRGLRISPVVFFAVAFSIGILFGKVRGEGVSFLLLLLWAIIFLILAALNRNQPLYFNTYLFAQIFILGWLAFIHSRPHSPRHIANIARDRSITVELKGVVASDPIRTKRQVIFVFSASQIESGKPVEGHLQVRSYRLDVPIQYGDELLIQGALFRPPRIGEFDYRAYLARRNIYALLAVKKEGRLEIIRRAQASLLIASALKWRRGISGILSRYLKGEPGNFLRSILIGEYEALSKETKEVFRRTGTLHIIAISGLNVGLVASIFMAVFKVLFVSRKALYGSIIPILFIYAAMCGAQASVVRATIMASIVALGFILGRDVDIYNSVALAALFILFYNPNQLFNVGFQLSFVAVLALLYLPKRIVSIIGLGSLYGIKRYIVNSISASLSAGLATAPIIAFNFHIVTPIMIIANLMVVPFAFFITVCGFLMIFLHFLLPPVASFVGGAATLSINMMFASLRALSRFPYSWFSL